VVLRPVRRLSADLVNKIAAGEVVERPASVVKELVENSLDAGARSVHVEIEAGGKGLIRVRDDGHGMARADAELALERHATSKLETLEDLSAIASHGFRGEALPSIASVSCLVLQTRNDASSAGTEVLVKHGRPGHVKDAGHPRGTTVEVRDLFAAVPARRKFLRADSTEAAHVAEALTLLALARPGIGFSLRSGGRVVLEAPPVDSLGPRLFQVYGKRFLEDLVAVDGGTEWAGVSGYVSRPDRSRPARANLRLFVNHRPVRDRAVSKAVIEAYRAAGGGDRGFDAFLFLDVPPHVVDVNVHPAKTEVRFADTRTVWTAVERAVRGALSAGAKTAIPRADTSRVEAAVQRYLDGVPADTATMGPYTYMPSPPPLVAEPIGAIAESAAVFAESPAVEPALVPLVLGQHRQIYIVATDGEELVLVDQHTAHERVRFEGLLADLARRSVASQRLLTPAVVELPPDLRPVLEAHAEVLGAMGYEVDAFGAGSTRVAAVPAVLGTREPGPALERILRDLHERESGDWTVAGIRDRLAATLACHSAVRAGQGLAAESMAAIVRDLFRTAHPTLCPHGRPTLVRLPREEVSRWFGRTGWKRQ
jgi:DNA mismatch repair protein MutL